MTEQINYHRRFLFTTLLQVAFIVIELYYGFVANSMALVSDAIHNASDVLGLLISWGGFALARVRTSQRFTFGFKNSTILAAFVNAVFIFVAVGGIGWEAIQRLGHPEKPDSYTVLWVAGAGVIVNGLSAVMFMSGKKDINIKGAFLHLAGDAAVSFGVIIASVCILLTSWYWLDPAASILITILIMLSSWGLFKESIKLLLHAVPDGIHIDEVKDFLLTQSHVIGLHDLHIWAISTTETALSVHLVMSEEAKEPSYLHSLATALDKRFGINHATIQLELEGSSTCETNC
ncbi:MAG: cation diffusion facilitator family transporter [Candidatus Berkiella sp.]